MKKYIQNIAVICLLVFFSCTKDNPISPIPVPRPPMVKGIWKDSTVPLTISLSESDGVISGAGTILNYYSLTVSGKNRYPIVIFSIGTYGYAPATFTGRFVGKDSISGSLTGNIFYNDQINLVREK